MVPMHLSIVTFIDVLFGFLLNIIALIKFIKLFLFQNGIKEAQKQVGAIFLSYLIIIFVDCFFGIIYFSYFIIFWRPGQSYNSYGIFIVGFPFIAYFKITAVSATFLTIYRVFLLLPKYMFNYLLHKIIIIIGIFLGVGLFLYDSIVYFLKFKGSNVTCASFCCTIGVENCQFFVQCKMFFGFCNIILGIFMFFIVLNLQGKTNSESLQRTKARKRLNKLTFITLLSDVICNLFPHLIDIIFNNIANISLQNIIGPYSTISSAIHSLIIALLYCKKLGGSLESHVNNITNVTIVVVKPISNTTMTKING